MASPERLRNTTSEDDDSSECSSSIDGTNDGEFDHQEPPPSKLMWLVDKFVIFGDSKLGLSASILMLLVAVGTALWINKEEDGENTYLNDIAVVVSALFRSVSVTLKYWRLGPVPSLDPPKIYEVSHHHRDASKSYVTDEIRAAYEKDGVVAVRGLLQPELLQRLDEASKELVQDQQEKDKRRRNKRTNTQFHMVKMGTVFLDPPDENQENDSSAFRQVALHSSIPKFAADLLRLSTEKNETLRLMRDIFLTKDDEEYVCGWHVDDLGFWPAIGSAPGVNAWVAIDDMPTKGGGGFALAVRSHSASWRDDAHRAIGSTVTFPKLGFQSVADMFENRTGAGTCNMETEAPHLHRRMEETRRVYEVKRGDVLFHERWLFHRTVPFDRSLVKKRNENGQDELIYRRFSLRYGPGSSEIPCGYGTELSVLWNEENGGRTADDVALLDGPWYPQCWPSASKDEMQQLGHLIQEKMPVAEERRKKVQNDMQPYLKKAAKDQHHRTARGSRNKKR